MPVYGVLLELLILALAVTTGWFLGRGTAAREALDAAAVDAVRREITDLRALVARIKDTAWDERELDPALATVIIDEIRAYEKKELGS